MSAPSDGARADARKRLAAEVVAPEEYALALEICHEAHPTRWEFRTASLGSCDECCDIAVQILTSDWLAGVIADAKAEERERIEQLVRGNRTAYLSSYDLDPAWIAGWHSATDDHAARIKRSGR